MPVEQSSRVMPEPSLWPRHYLMLQLLVVQSAQFNQTTPYITTHSESVRDPADSTQHPHACKQCNVYWPPSVRVNDEAPHSNKQRLNPLNPHMTGPDRGTVEESFPSFSLALRKRLHHCKRYLAGVLVCSESSGTTRVQAIWPTQMRLLVV